MSDSVSIEGCLLRLSYGGGKQEQSQGFKLTGGPDGGMPLVGGASMLMSLSDFGCPGYLNP